MEGTFTIDCLSGSIRVLNTSRCNCKVLENQPGAVCLIYDIVVYGKDLEEHDERLPQVFERLSNAKITVNEEKCQLRKPDFLGHSVGKDGIKPDTAKVLAVVGIEASQQSRYMNYHLAFRD